MARIIRITESQFNDYIRSEKEKLHESGKRNKQKSKKDFEMDYVKANRKGRREEERDRYGDGFKATTRVSKSEKNYSRKGKNKNNWKEFSDED